MPQEADEQQKLRDQLCDIVRHHNLPLPEAQFMALLAEHGIQLLSEKQLQLSRLASSLGFVR